MSLQYFPPSFGLIRLTIREQKWFEDFQDGCHCGHTGYRNRTILAILNLYVTPMPPIKFWLNQTCSLGGDDIWRISRWPPWQPSWISERNNFSTSESQCLPPSFGLIWLIFWGQMSFEDFQDGQHGSQLGYQNIMILAVLNLHVIPMPPIKFQLKLNYSLGRDVVWRISWWLPWRPSLISDWNILAILNLHVPWMPPIKFQFNPTYHSKDVKNVKS